MMVNFFSRGGGACAAYRMHSGGQSLRWRQWATVTWRMKTIHAIKNITFLTQRSVDFILILSLVTNQISLSFCFPLYLLLFLFHSPLKKDSNNQTNFSPSSLSLSLVLFSCTTSHILQCITKCVLYPILYYLLLHSVSTISFYITVTTCATRTTSQQFHHSPCLICSCHSAQINCSVSST